MGANDGEDGVRLSIIAVEEVLGRDQQRLDGGEELAMGHFPTEVAPEHLDRIQPGTVGWQVQ